MKNGLIIDEYGNKRYYKNKLLHRVDGPAIEYISGDKCWCLNGLEMSEEEHAEAVAKNVNNQSPVHSGLILDNSIPSIIIKSILKVFTNRTL